MSQPTYHELRARMDAQSPGAAAAPAVAVVPSPDGQGSILSTVVGGALAVGALGLLAIPFRPASQREMLLINLGLLLALLAIRWFHARFTPTRPVPFVDMFLLLGLMQPVSMTLAVLVQGEVDYYTELGVVSHSLRAGRVAWAYALFYGAIAAGSLVAQAGQPRGAAVPWHSRLDQVSSTTLRMGIWLALGAGVARLVLLFEFVRNLAFVGYSLRVALTALMAAPVAVGIGLRRGVPSARVAALLLAPIYLLILASGSRSDALFPTTAMGVGYVLARPISARRLWIGLAFAVFASWALLMFGELMRSDDRARTGDAAVERVGNVGETLSRAQESYGEGTSPLISPLRRFVRNSTHATIALVPEMHPHDVGALSDVPHEFSSRLLPQLNLEGRLDLVAPPRHWMLRELGFIISETTSVELAILPDAWFRGGWAAVLGVGLYIGLFLALLERALYARLERSPDRLLFLAMLGPIIFPLDAQDFVGGTRAVILILFSLGTIFGTLRIFMLRRENGPGRSVDRGGAAPRALALVAEGATPDASGRGGRAQSDGPSVAPRGG